MAFLECREGLEKGVPDKGLKKTVRATSAILQHCRILRKLAEFRFWTETRTFNLNLMVLTYFFFFNEVHLRTAKPKGFCVCFQFLPLFHNFPEYMWGLLGESWFLKFALDMRKTENQCYFLPLFHPLSKLVSVKSDKIHSS